MNEMQQKHGSLLERAASNTIKAAIEAFAITIISGARQTGKSTLVSSLPHLDHSACFSLDDLSIRDQARRDARSLLGQGPALILDEVQRDPALLLAVKQAVDEDVARRPGRFVLMASADLSWFERASDSLGGRARSLRLWPLTRRERLGLGRTGIWTELLDTPVQGWLDLTATEDLPEEDWREATALGGFPVPVHELRTPGERASWHEAYLTTYLERDLQLLSAIDKPADFRRLMRAAARRVGTVLNQADLAREVSLPRPTVHRWLNLLEASFQIVRVAAYAVTRTKRLVKSARLYWGDVGMGRWLAGGEATGAHMENLVLNDLLSWRDTSLPPAEVRFWRTANGEEVDFVIDRDGALLPIQVLAVTRPTAADARHLVTFAAEYGRAVHGALVLHAGTDTFQLAQGILALPWWRVL